MFLGHPGSIADAGVLRLRNLLFLTVKTIETHLRNIFRKLDVSSRVEVARRLERERREESR